MMGKLPRYFSLMKLMDFFAKFRLRGKINNETPVDEAGKPVEGLSEGLGWMGWTALAGKLAGVLVTTGSLLWAAVSLYLGANPVVVVLQLGAGLLLGSVFFKLDDLLLEVDGFVGLIVHYIRGGKIQDYLHPVEEV